MPEPRPETKAEDLARQFFSRYRMMLIIAGILFFWGLGALLWCLKRCYWKIPSEAQDFIVMVTGTVLVVLNYRILVTMIVPLKKLFSVIAGVSSGNLDARAEISPSEGEYVKSFVLSFNRMMDTVKAAGTRYKDMAIRMITVQEEERKRIAQDLHDETNQALSSLVMDLERLEAALRTFPHFQEEVSRLKDLIKSELTRLRNMAYILRPPLLEEKGLRHALQWFLHNELEGREIHVEFSFGQSRRLPSDIELSIFRIVQEVVFNIIRHARASSVLVRVAVGKECIDLEIKDNGIGFDPVEIEKGSGSCMGLRGMRERVELLSGSLKMESFPGKGTRVLVTVPVRLEEEA